MKCGIGGDGQEPVRVRDVNIGYTGAESSAGAALVSMYMFRLCGTGPLKMSSLSEGLAATLFDAAQLFRRLSQQHGLKTAQWSAIRWIADGRGPKTASGFASHHQVSLGAAVQTLRALEKKGVITSVQDPVDGRRRLLALGPEGERMLRSDPLRAVQAAIERQPPERVWVTLQTLKGIVAGGRAGSVPENDPDAGNPAAPAEARRRAHDLRQELTTIMGLAEILARDEASAEDRLRTREYARAILASGARVLDMVSDQRLPWSDDG